jgi:O-antigen ligase
MPWRGFALTPGMSSQEKISSEPFWLLWALASSAAWLIPNFSLPWVSFDREWVATFAVVLLAAALALSSRQRWTLPWGVPAVAAVALVPILQWASGLIYFGGDAWMSVLYIIGFALAIVIGARAQQVHGSRWLDAFHVGIGLAATLSVGIAFYQWLQLDTLDPWLISIAPEERPAGNVAQANLLALLLGWGLVSAWWAYLTRRLRGSVAFLWATFLLFGLVLTQSRTAWVFVGFLMPTFAVWYRRQLRTADYWPALVALWVAFCVGVVFWIWLNASGHVSNGTPLASRAAAGTRLQHWHAMLQAVQERPWLGWGWHQVSVAQSVLSTGFAPEARTGELIHFSHDLVLDLLVWNGIPLGMTVVAGMGLWLALVMRRIDSATGALTLLVIAVLLVHAMLEYPFAYTFVLLPIGLMVGTLAALYPARRSWMVPRIGMLAVFVLMTAALAWTTRDYLVAKASLERLRFEHNRVGPYRNSPPPQLDLLTQLQAWATVDRMKIDDEASEADRELMRRTSARYPSEFTILRLAIGDARLGDTQRAHLELVRLCNLHPKATCDQSRAAWTELGRTKYPFLQQVPFPPP